MDVKLQNVDIVILSHGHYDHTGGLIEVLKRIKKRVPVIAHPTVFVPKLKVTPHLKFVGASFNSSRVESVGGVLLLAANPLGIDEGITTTGEVPRTTSLEKVRGFRTVYTRKFVDDLMLDDQSLVIDVDN